MTASLVVDNGVCRLCIEAEQPCVGMLDQLARFLAPYFRPSTDEKWVHATIQIAPYVPAIIELERAAIHPVEFRRSSCPEYNLHGFVGVRPDGKIVAHDARSATGYEVDHEARRVVFYGSPDNSGSAIHLHDFVRYLALLICESHGHLLLHASAVTIEDRLVLVLGDKGAGKTTTMLNFVAHQGARYCSGDKVLVSFANGRLIFRAWPDIPYIGVGSLRSHPQLAAALNISLVDAADVPVAANIKQLVDPFLFRSVIPQSQITCSDDLAAIVLPNVHAAPGMHWIPGPERHAKFLAEFVEWPHRFLISQWHKLYLDEARRGVADEGRAVLSALAEIPWLALNGKIAPPPLLGACG